MMKLNKKILTLMLVFGVCATAAVAQITVVTGDNIKKSEPIDELVFRAQYELKMLEDTTRSDSKPNSETMMLEVGKKSSLLRLYHLSPRLCPYGGREEQRVSGTHGRTYLRIRQCPHHLSYLQNHPAGKVTTLDRIVTTNFRCEEKRQAAMDSPARYCHYPDLSVPESLLPFPRAQLHGMVHDGNPRQ